MAVLSLSPACGRTPPWQRKDNPEASGKGEPKPEVQWCVCGGYAGQAGQYRKGKGCQVTPPGRRSMGPVKEWDGWTYRGGCGEHVIDLELCLCVGEE